MTGIFFTAAAVVLRIISNPLGNLFQKQLTAKGNHPLAINFLTYLLLSIVCILIGFFIHWPPLSSTFWLYSILGGIAGGIGNGFLVKALERGDLSVLGPINAYKSVVGIITGMFLLKEFPNIWGIAGIALIIWGSYFVLDTTEEKFSGALLRKPEIQFRIWAMILTAIEAVFEKKVILSSSPGIAFMSWCVFGGLFSFLFLLLNSIPVKKLKMQSGDFSLYLWLLLCIATMQLTTNYALAHLPVGYALSLFQLSILVSVFLGHHIFKEKDIRKKMIGSVIMIAGSVLIILLKD